MHIILGPEETSVEGSEQPRWPFALFRLLHVSYSRLIPRSGGCLGRYPSAKGLSGQGIVETPLLFSSWGMYRNGEL